MTCTTPNCTAITVTLLNRHHEAVPQNVCLCCWLTLLGICFMHVPVWDSRAVSSLAAGPGTVESSARGCFYTVIHLSQAQHTKGHRRMSNKNITTEHELHAQKDQERDDSNAKLNSYVCIICVMWPTRQSALCLWPKEDNGYNAEVHQTVKSHGKQKWISSHLYQKNELPPAYRSHL